MGALFIIGLLTDLVGRRTFLPRVTLLLLVGVLIGDSGLKILPEASEKWYPFIANMALIMVGFLLGGKLTLRNLVEQGKQPIVISTSVVACTILFVSAGLILLGIPWTLALVLGSIATSTAPAATEDSITENKADGPFTRLLSSIVAIDDAWGLLAFGLVLAGVQFAETNAADTSLALSIFTDIGGAILLGIAIGLPAAFLTGRLEKGEPTLAEALGVVFVCGGMAMMLDVSYLIAAITMGAVVANTARHHNRPFHAIQGIEWPFLILFFILAGATADMSHLRDLGVIGSGYVLFRIAGRLAGVRVGAYACDSPKNVRQWMGWALTPQAGIAMGVALVASEKLPTYQTEIMTIVVSSTVLFEIAGPLLTKWALRQSGEAGKLST